MRGSRTITRASFLKRCSILAAVAVAESIGVFRWSALLAPLHRLQVEHATASLFKRHVNERFRVRLPQRTIRVVLMDVIERPVTHGFEQFSALFRGPAGEELADGIYRFEHPSFGAADLFVVAVGADRKTYEACFSRPVQKA